MNWIQRTGVLAMLPIYFVGEIWPGRLGSVLGLVAWSAIFLGYVAGNLWRFRHAVHFWPSVTFAFCIHTCLFPTYMHLDELAKFSNRNGKGYMQMSFGLLIVEVITLLFVLKHFAIWLHRRMHSKSLKLNGRGAL